MTGPVTGQGPVRAHWFLPTSGDGREVIGWVHSNTATDDPRAVGRAPDLDYLADVARTAERAGFEAVLTPTGTWCEEAWLTTAALTQLTKRLKFIVAFRPDWYPRPWQRKWPRHTKESPPDDYY